MQAKLKPGVPRARRSKDVTADDLMRRLDTDFWAGEDRELMAVLLPLLATAAEDSAAQLAEQVEGYGLGLDWTLANAEAVTWARDYAGELVKGVNRTTRKQVGATVSGWLDTPDSTMGDLFGALQGQYSFSPSRAEAVAVTEVTRSYAEGNLVTARAVERENLFTWRKFWNTNNDDKVCPICRPLHGQSAEGADGDDWTGVGPFVPAPPAHVRCRCWVTFEPVVPLAGFEGEAYFSDIGSASGRAVYGGGITFNSEDYKEWHTDQKRFAIGHEIAHHTVENYVLRDMGEWNLAEETLKIGEARGRLLFAGGNMVIGEAVADSVSAMLCEPFGGDVRFGGLSDRKWKRIMDWAHDVTSRAGYDEDILRQDIERIRVNLDGQL